DPVKMRNDRVAVPSLPSATEAGSLRISGRTLTTKLRVAVPKPSLTVTVISATPLWPAAGSQYTDPPVAGLVYSTTGCGISAGFDDCAVTVSGWDSPAPALTPENATARPPCPSRRSGGAAISARVGGSS